MLIDPLSEIKKYSGLTGDGLRFFWGRVISNEDPKMLCRIKCQIHDLLPFSTKETLPWMYPLFPAGLGEGPKTSYHYVPEEESFVIIVFPYDSIYFGWYIGHTISRQTRMIDFMSHYPERYGFQDSLENKWIVDKHLQTEERRFSDQSLGIWDSKNSKYSFRDKFGTKVQIDRKNQTAIVNFGGVRFRLEDGVIKVEFKELIGFCFKHIKVAVKDGIWLTSKVFRYLGKIFSVAASEVSISEESNYEQSTNHPMTGTKNSDSGVSDGVSSSKGVE